MNLLVISNMGAHDEAPMQGKFVDDQVARIVERSQCFKVDYFNMSWNGNKLRHRLFKYIVFFLRFIYVYIFSRTRIDIIHVHYFYPTIFCAVLYRLFRNKRVKIIVTCHGSDIYSYPNPNSLYRAASRHVDHWLFASAQLKERFYTKLEHSTVLCAGFDNKVFKASNDEIEREYDFLFVGTLNHNKGVDRLIWLAEQCSNLKFAVVGEGPLKSTLRDGAHNNIAYKGCLPSTELSELMKRSKFLLSLSRNESFGLVMAEANACGTPAVATLTDGALCHLNHDDFLISQDRSEEEVRESIKGTILAAANLDIISYSKIRANAIKRAQKYSLTYVVDELLELYKKC